MAKKQQTLVLFPDVFISTKKMSDEQFGALMRAVFSYRFEGSAYEGEDLVVDVAFAFVKTQLDRYAQVCETNRINAKKHNCEEAADAVSEMQRNAAECNEMQRNTPHTHTHNHNHTHTRNHSHTHTRNHTQKQKEKEADKPPRAQIVFPQERIMEVYAKGPDPPVCEYGCLGDSSSSVTHQNDIRWVMVIFTKLKTSRVGVENLSDL